MINFEVKNLLVECLNENIRQEDIFLRYSLYEANGSTAGGSTGSVSGSTGSISGSTGTSPAGSTFPTSPVPGGLTTGPKMFPSSGGGYTGSGISLSPASGIGGGAGAGGSAPSGETFDAGEIGYDILQQLGVAGAIGLQSNLMVGLQNMASKFGLGGVVPYGGRWYMRNVANILRNEEELRKEGLGYTKGWAKLADTTKD
jgi:hypothetical protein